MCLPGLSATVLDYDLNLGLRSGYSKPHFGNCALWVVDASHSRTDSLSVASTSNSSDQRRQGATVLALTSEINGENMHLQEGRPFVISSPAGFASVSSYRPRPSKRIRRHPCFVPSAGWESRNAAPNVGSFSRRLQHVLLFPSTIAKLHLHSQATIQSHEPTRAAPVSCLLEAPQRPRLPDSRCRPSPSAETDCRPNVAFRLWSRKFL